MNSARNVALSWVVAAATVWGDWRRAEAQAIDLDPPEVVVVRDAGRTAEAEDRFVQSFIAASPIFRAPVRMGTVQKELDGEGVRTGAMALGRRALDEAIEAYGRLDAKAGFAELERAREAFTRALGARAEATRAVAELARVHLTAAAFHVAVGNLKGAEVGFEAALGIDPTVRFDAARFSPTMARALDEARGRFLRRVPVVTLVTSQPEGATVELAGAVVGVTPLKVRVRPGHRTLVLRRPGFEAALIPITGAVPPEASATLARTRLAAEWAGWCRGVVGGRKEEKESTNAVPVSLNEKRGRRSLIVVEADGGGGFAVCGLVGSDAPGFGIRMSGVSPADETALFWREHDRVHRRFVLKRLSDRDALDVSSITNIPLKKDLVVARRWYERWWVWAAVGAAVVAGSSVGIFLGTKGPTTSGVSIRF